PTLIYTLSLHDALPIFTENDITKTVALANTKPNLANFHYLTGHIGQNLLGDETAMNQNAYATLASEIYSIEFNAAKCMDIRVGEDRKSTRLNSSHVAIS